MAAISTPGSDATANRQTTASREIAVRREVVNALVATLQQLAERFLGGTISPSEWVEAKKYAEEKLGRIIEREGDQDGVRREPWYLAQLIAETVLVNRFSQFTLDFADVSTFAEEQIGLKKGKPASKDADHPNSYNPIVSQPHRNCNRRIQKCQTI